jgi:hypothetical protein
VSGLHHVELRPRSLRYYTTERPQRLCRKQTRRMSRSRVVHDCPSGGMNWRSSSHTGHRGGGASLVGYCVPQVEQMNAGIVSPV